MSCIVIIARYQMKLLKLVLQIAWMFCQKVKNIFISAKFVFMHHVKAIKIICYGHYHLVKVAGRGMRRNAF